MMGATRNKMLAATLACAATLAEKTDEEQLTAREMQRRLGLADIVCDIDDARNAIREVAMASWLERVNAIEPYRWRITPQGIAALVRMGDGIARRISEIEDVTDRSLARHAPVPSPRRPRAEKAAAPAPVTGTIHGDNPEAVRKFVAEHPEEVRALVDRLPGWSEDDEADAELDENVSVATVCLSETAIEYMWNALSTQDKAEVIVHHLETKELAGRTAPDLTDAGRRAAQERAS